PVRPYLPFSRARDDPHLPVPVGGQPLADGELGRALGQRLAVDREDAVAALEAARLRRPEAARDRSVPQPVCVRKP
ncbi:MAG TPA: hypothetical protein VGB65_03675, partial [Allosphingosinicella sp.]